MASQTRAETDAVRLFDSLQRESYSFDFFDVMRRLECAYPEEPRLGESQHAGREPIRLGQDPTMAFAPATLSSFQPRKEGRPPRLGVYFFGLLGANGPLPLHLTEYVHDRLYNQHDATLAAFLDIFHHRLLSLFYRAWANSQPAVSFDRPDTDRFGDYLASLFGTGSEPLKNRDAMPDLAKRYYAGRLAVQAHNVEGLQAILQDFLGLPVSLQEFAGEWMDLPDGSICRLGESTETGTLGLTLILGERIWQSQHKFRILVGALDFQDYQRLLPGGVSLQRLIAVVRNYLGDELEWDLRLILKQPEIPAPSLDGRCQLGWTSWLTQEPLGRDGDDLILNPGQFNPNLS